MSRMIVSASVRKPAIFRAGAGGRGGQLSNFQRARAGAGGKKKFSGRGPRPQGPARENTEFYNFQKNSEMVNLGLKTRMGTHTPNLASGFVGFQNLKIFDVSFCRFLFVFVGFYYSKISKFSFFGENN